MAVGLLGLEGLQSSQGEGEAWGQPWNMAYLLHQPDFSLCK